MDGLIHSLRYWLKLKMILIEWSMIEWMRGWFTGWLIDWFVCLGLYSPGSTTWTSWTISWVSLAPRPRTTSTASSTRRPGATYSLYPTNQRCSSLFSSTLFPLNLSSIFPIYAFSSLLAIFSFSLSRSFFSPFHPFFPFFFSVVPYGLYTYLFSHFFLLEIFSPSSPLVV